MDTRPPPSALTHIILALSLRIARAGAWCDLSSADLYLSSPLRDAFSSGPAAALFNPFRGSPASAWSPAALLLPTFRATSASAWAASYSDTVCLDNSFAAAAQGSALLCMLTSLILLARWVERKRLQAGSTGGQTFARGAPTCRCADLQEVRLLLLCHPAPLIMLTNLVLLAR